MTAREIVGRASANLASIPYHFGTKDALVAEALITETRELIAPVLALLADERPGPERAVEIVSLLADIFEISKDEIPVYLAALAATPHDEAVRDALAQLWQELRSRLAEDIQRQLGAVQLPDWASPHAMAGLILAVVNGVVIASVVDRTGPDHRQMARQFLSLLLAARGLPGAAPSTHRPVPAREAQQ